MSARLFHSGGARRLLVCLRSSYRTRVSVEQRVVGLSIGHALATSHGVFVRQSVTNNAWHFERRNRTKVIENTLAHKSALSWGSITLYMIALTWLVCLLSTGIARMIHPAWWQTVLTCGSIAERRDVFTLTAITTLSRTRISKAPTVNPTWCQGDTIRGRQGKQYNWDGLWGMIDMASKS